MCFSWGKMWQNCIMKILSPKIYILQLRANLVLQYSQEEGPQLPCWSSTRPGTRRTSAPEETTPDTRAFATLFGTRCQREEFWSSQAQAWTRREQLMGSPSEEISANIWRTRSKLLLLARTVKSSPMALSLECTQMGAGCLIGLTQEWNTTRRFAVVAESMRTAAPIWDENEIITLRFLHNTLSK